MEKRIRIDEAQKKRVELRLHTNYSEEDGILDISEAIRRAKTWGMNALAVTDHSVIQAFPDAHQEVADDPDFKTALEMNITEWKMYSVLDCPNPPAKRHCLGL